MKNVPKRIYLQVGDEAAEDDTLDFRNDLDDVTWAEDQVFQSDIEYVRADLVREMWRSEQTQ